MALVRASQSLIMEGYTEIKEKPHWLKKGTYVREKISLRTWVWAICDEEEAGAVIEEKIKQKMKETSGWGRNFEGWSSYRVYCNPGEVGEEPNGTQWKLKLSYIRDWKMERIMEELDGNQFSILCKELGIGAGEALIKPK